MEVIIIKRLLLCVIVFVIPSLVACAPNALPVTTLLPATETTRPIDNTFTPTLQPTETLMSTITPSPKPTQVFVLGATMVSDKDGMVLIYIPAGEFVLGSEDHDDNEKPLHAVSLDAYWIDQTEVTNAMYRLCLDAGGCKEPRHKASYTQEIYFENPDFDNFPVIYVSWNNANDYCSWAGRRLPTEAEWEKAASWDPETQEKYLYPWGNKIDCLYANYWGGENMYTGCIAIQQKLGCIHLALARMERLI